MAGKRGKERRGREGKRKGERERGRRGVMVGRKGQRNFSA